MLDASQSSVDVAAQETGAMAPVSDATISQDVVSSLRAYQAGDVNDMREAIRAGAKRIVFYGSTGYGKGSVATWLLHEMYAKGKRACFIVDRITLINDISERLDAAGVPHGIIQASNPRNRPWERIQVCSSQTLAFRKLPACDAILYDEAHCLHSGAWKQVEASDAIVIGLTATPFTKGMKDKFEVIVGSTTTNQLVEQGSLAPVRIFTGREIDMKGAKTVAGEWSSAEVTERGTKIVCDVVETWKKTTFEHFGKAEKTLVFSSSIKHGEALKEQFDESGYRFEQVSSHTPDDVTNAFLKEFKDPNSDLVGLISVEKLAKGFDAPSVRIGVGCRPYRKSFSAFIQSLGRVMRSAPGKDYAVWIDHAGCVPRFMDDMAELFENGCHELNGGSKLEDKVHKEPTDKKKKEVHCVCGTIMMPWYKTCPTCGKPRLAVRTDVEQVAGRMEEVTLAARRNKETGIGDKAAWLAAFKGYGQMHGRKPGWALNCYRKRFSVWPNDSRIRDVKPGIIFKEALGYIKHLNVAYAKGMNK